MRDSRADQINLVLQGQHRDLPDFPKVNCNAHIWIFTSHTGGGVPFFEIDSHVLLKFIGVPSHIELHRYRTSSFP
jgi:hypothetical protein